MKDFNELIEAYLKDELQGDEKINFEEQLSKDDELRSQYNLAYEVRQAFRYSDLESKLEFVKSLESDPPESGNQKKNKWLWLILFGLLSLGLVYLSVKEKSKKPTSSWASIFEVKNFDQFILHSTLRSSQSTNFTIQQKKAYNLYAAQSFDNAIPLLETLWENQNDTLALYYLGISYLGIGQNEKSNDILTQTALTKFKKPKEEKK